MTTPIAAGRIACSVPFCRRTAAKDRHPGCTEIICGRCWREGVPKPLRVIYGRAYRLAKRAAERAEAARLGMQSAAPPRSPGLVMEWHSAWAARDRSVARCGRLWRICKRRAIEARAGLA